MRKVIKLIKNNILGFIIGAVIFTGVGVSAATYLYSSNQISYSNSNSSATDVKTALDELYEKSSFKKYIIKDGVIQDGYSLIYDSGVTTIFENNILKMSGSNTIKSGIKVSADVTNMNYIYLAAIGSNNTSYMWSFGINDESVKTADKSYIDVSGLTGIVSIYIKYFGGNERIVKIKDLWME